MKSYIDVGVVRVQRYLARPRRLRTQRGGSALIKFATSKMPSRYAAPKAQKPATIAKGQPWDPVADYCKCLEEKGHQGWKRNDEAGDIAGVVSVVHKGGREVSKDELHQCADLLMGWLRDGLPNAELEAYGISTAKTYVKAYDKMHAQDCRLGTALPLMTDFPGLLPCDECGASPVVDQKPLRDPDTKQVTILRVCDDCAKRLDDHGRQAELASQAELTSPSKPASPSEPTDQTAWLVARTFLVESKLLAKITKGRRKRLGDGSDVKAAEDFANLADLQIGSSRSNHLATVWIDGDSIGERFKKLEDPELRRKAVARLSQATKHALIKASKAICEDKYDKCPVIPHVLGGDDVVVTLVASKAWRFVRTFLSAFEKRTQQWLPGATASAAMVFARQNYPFAAQLDRAEELLGQTKRHAARYRRDRDPEKTSCVGWVDLTREDSLAISEFHLSLDEIAGIKDDLDALDAKVSATQREAWVRLLCDPDTDHARARIYSDARRVGNLPLVRRLFPNNAVLRQRLEMLRWWNA